MLYRSVDKKTTIKRVNKYYFFGPAKKSSAVSYDPITSISWEDIDIACGVMVYGTTFYWLNISDSNYYNIRNK